jgi:hypothetical protein
MARVWEWTLEEAQVTVTISAFGKLVASCNGVEQGRANTLLAGLRVISFDLPGGALASLRYGPQDGVFCCDLLREGQLVLPVRAPTGAVQALFRCPKCAAPLKAVDKFCEACGKQLPSVEQRLLEAPVQRGNSAIGGLSVLFMLSGVAGLAADTPLAEPVPGVASTVGELRTQLEWEALSGLLVNGVLAVLMLGLWQWGKKQPGAAITIAFCTYLVVIAVNFAIDPKTIAQGLIVKIFVIMYLVRGLKAALALRSQRANV